jgi:arylsulfatase A-like enzyme
MGFAAPRRAALASIALVLLLAGAAGCGSRGSSGEPATVLLVTLDTVRADRLGCYGRANAGTPQLDALAGRGARFASAYTTAPVTLSAHASIFTGRTIPAHLVLSNGPYALPSDVPTLAAQFQQAGYATGAFVGTKLLGRQHGFDRGFAVYDDQIPPPPRGAPVFRSEERAARDTVGRALAWLDGIGSQPAFLWIHVWEPHTPYAPPPEVAARFGGDAYQGEIAVTDEAIGLLLQGLEARGRAGRLLVAVVGDHGESLGEHGEPTHGIFLYQATMHVPMLIAGPGHGVRGGTTVDVPVSVTDLAPTLLELAGLPALPYADGLSLAGLLRGTAGPPSRPGVSAESHMPQIEYGWSGLRAFVSGTTKVIDAPRPEVYDVAADPGERTELSAGRADAIAEARRQLEDGLRRAVANAPTGSAAMASREEDLAALRALGYAASGRRGDDAPRELVDPHAVDPKDREEFITRFHEAVSLTQSNRPREALVLFDQLERVEPQNITLLLEKGNALIVDRQLDAALALFRRTVEIDPEFAVGWHRIGQLLDAKRDVAGAEAAYRRALEADPSSVMSLKALAGICWEQQRWDEGIALLELVVKLDPADPRAARDLETLKAKKAGTR